MSKDQFRRTEDSKHLCQHRRDSKARLRYRGVVRADNDHPPSLTELRRASTLCFECYRREVNQARARGLVNRTALSRSPFADMGTRTLDDRQRAHRQRMMEHLFDQGYLTVTPEYQIKVGQRLREDYDNGKTYYPLDKQALNPPVTPSELPGRDFLAWHNEHVFRG